MDDAKRQPKIRRKKMYKIPESFIFAFVSKEKKNELPRAAQRPSLSMGMYVWNYEGEKWKKKKNNMDNSLKWYTISRGRCATKVSGCRDKWHMTKGGHTTSTRISELLFFFFWFYADFLLTFFQCPFLFVKLAVRAQ